MVYRLLFLALSCRVGSGGRNLGPGRTPLGRNPLVVGGRNPLVGGGGKNGLGGRPRRKSLDKNSNSNKNSNATTELFSPVDSLSDGAFALAQQLDAALTKVFKEHYYGIKGSGVREAVELCLGGCLAVCGHEVARSYAFWLPVRLATLSAHRAPPTVARDMATWLLLTWLSGVPGVARCSVSAVALTRAWHFSQRLLPNDNATLKTSGPGALILFERHTTKWRKKKKKKKNRLLLLLELRWRHIYWSVRASCVFGAAAAAIAAVSPWEVSALLLHVLGARMAIDSGVALVRCLAAKNKSFWRSTSLTFDLLYRQALSYGSYYYDLFFVTQQAPRRLPRHRRWLRRLRRFPITVFKKIGIIPHKSQTAEEEQESTRIWRAKTANLVDMAASLALGAFFFKRRTPLPNALRNTRILNFEAHLKASRTFF